MLTFALTKLGFISERLEPNGLLFSADIAVDIQLVTFLLSLLSNDNH